nr:DUF2158 domain-containing protein [Hyphomonas sp. Mor2]
MTFKVGAVVRLRSGGPKMTIAALKQDRCFCVWFNQNNGVHEERSGEFVLPTVVLVDSGHRVPAQRPAAQPAARMEKVSLAE